LYILAYRYRCPISTEKIITGYELRWTHLYNIANPHQFRAIEPVFERLAELRRERQSTPGGGVSSLLERGFVVIRATIVVGGMTPFVPHDRPLEV